ncbi:MAG: glycosyltransferase [Candidatus Omnitrophota bacterium]
MAEAKRVLLLYITDRSGHHSAALAIKRGLELKDRRVLVSCVNAFQYVFPVAERLIHRLYLAVIKKAPKIWEFIYDNPRVVKSSDYLKGKIYNLGINRLKRLLDEFRPDVVACTQAFPCGLVAGYKERFKVRLPLVGVLTDFAPHAFWVAEAVDQYVVPCEESRGLLVEKGVAFKKIKTLGIPIDPKFIDRLDRQELVANYGLTADVSVVLIMGGGHGLGPITQTLKNLDQAKQDLQMVVVCGLNKKLFDWIQRHPFKKRILSFKFTDQVDRLMSVASVIITKPGGITTAEALAKRIPMIILNPIPGQEARNTALLTKNKAAVKVDQVADVLPTIEKLLSQQKTFAGMSVFNPLAEYSKPHSALDIASMLLSLC